MKKKNLHTYTIKEKLWNYQKIIKCEEIDSLKIEIWITVNCLFYEICKNFGGRSLLISNTPCVYI